MTHVPLQHEGKTIRVESHEESLLMVFRTESGSLPLTEARAFIRSLEQNLAGTFRDRTSQGGRVFQASIQLEPEGEGCVLTISTFGQGHQLHLDAEDRRAVARVIRLLCPDCAVQDVPASGPGQARA